MIRVFCFKLPDFKFNLLANNRDFEVDRVTGSGSIFDFAEVTPSKYGKMTSFCIIVNVIHFNPIFFMIIIKE